MFSVVLFLSLWCNVLKHITKYILPTYTVGFWFQNYLWIESWVRLRKFLPGTSKVLNKCSLPSCQGCWSTYGWLSLALLMHTCWKGRERRENKTIFAALWRRSKSDTRFNSKCFPSHFSSITHLLNEITLSSIHSPGESLAGESHYVSSA